MNHTVNISFLETAIELSRMYGVAETLQPFDCISNDTFSKKIIGWTEEYLDHNPKKDIVAFFEEKMAGQNKRTEGEIPPK